MAECEERLAQVGERALAQGMRLTSHPSQYVVLNSENPGVRDAAVRDLELHAALFDAMGFGPESVVVLHVGSAGGGEKAGVDRFLAGVERLSDRARSRGTFCTTTARDPAAVPDREALELALATWPAGVTPKIHYSSPKTAVEVKRRKVGRRTERSLVLPQLRAHADLLDPIAFEHFVRETAAGLRFDIMLEAKAKDLALLRLREQLAARGVALS